MTVIDTVGSATEERAVDLVRSSVGVLSRALRLVDGAALVGLWDMRSRSIRRDMLKLHRRQPIVRRYPVAAMAFSPSETTEAVETGRLIASPREGYVLIAVDFGDGSALVEISKSELSPEAHQEGPGPGSGRG